MAGILAADYKSLPQVQSGFKSLLPYLHNMKEFWSLQLQVKENLLMNLPTRDSAKKINLTKDELKKLMLAQLQKN